MDVTSGLNRLKRHIFFELMGLTARVFILVKYSDSVILGNRGFLEQEKDNGIVLVFNSGMNFIWDDYGITATLVFGSSAQKCFIPIDSVISVYSPDLNVQFVAAPVTPDPGVQVPEKQKEKTEESAPSMKNVVKVDFTKKRR